jgi:hypothetical protein
MKLTLSFNHYRLNHLRLLWFKMNHATRALRPMRRAGTGRHDLKTTFFIAGQVSLARPERPISLPARALARRLLPSALLC